MLASDELRGCRGLADELFDPGFTVTADLGNPRTPRGG
jgi:hypothetical protein